MRVLITGSRTWGQPDAIAYVLESYIPLMERDVTIVSGACLQGADALCEKYAESVGWSVERHPADWRKYGKRAGHIRNAEMVALGADICIAFLKDNSPGTTGCIKAARAAGIKVVVIDG